MLSKICQNPCSCFGYRLSFNHSNDVIPIDKKPYRYGLGLIWLVCLLACMWGLVLVCLSFARGMGLDLFGWFSCWHLVMFVAGCCPSPIYRGGAVRFSFFFGGLGLLYSSWLFVGFYPFGNKFIIIQKKKKEPYR